MAILVGVGSDTVRQLGNRWILQAEQVVQVWWKEDDAGSRVSVEEVPEGDGRSLGGAEDISTQLQGHALQPVQTSSSHHREENGAATASSVTPSSIFSPTSLLSDFLDDGYRTVLYSAHVPIGHPTSQSFRHIASSATHRTRRKHLFPNPEAAATSVPLGQSNAQIPRQQPFRHHSWPLPAKRTQSTSGWGGAGLLGVAEAELEVLKRQRRATRALTKRVKQSLRGEIDSWEINDDTDTPDSASTNGRSLDAAEGTTPHGWSTDSCTPISDEEWGEDGDYGGVPADLSELMVVDEEKAAHWWSTTEGVDGEATEKDSWEASVAASDSGFTIAFPRSSNGTSPTTDESVSMDGQESDLSRLGTNVVADSACDGEIGPLQPSSPSKEMFTPLSPALSPEVYPSMMDMIVPEDTRLPENRIKTTDTLFSSFSAIHLTTSRKRQHPGDSALDSDDNSTLEVNIDDHPLPDFHPKKKAFSRSGTV